MNLGRSTRVVPHRIAALILDRDRMCRNPLCTATKGLEVHHVVHWTDGGPTNTSNLGALCRHCHRAHHAGKFSITGNADNPDGLTFHRPDGTTSKAPPNPPRQTGHSRSQRNRSFIPPGNAGSTVTPGSLPTRHPTRRHTTPPHRTTGENVAPYPNPRRTSRMGTQILRLRRNTPRQNIRPRHQHRRPRTRRTNRPLAPLRQPTGIKNQGSVASHSCGPRYERAACIAGGDG